MPSAKCRMGIGTGRAAVLALLLAGLMLAWPGAATGQQGDPPPPPGPVPPPPTVQPPTSTQPDTRTIRIQTIGFDVGGVAERQLRDMATAGGGRYFPAANEGELLAALGTAAGVTLTQTLTAEKEPNNTFGTANPAAANGAISGSIDPQRDDDWFVLDVDQPGLLDVKVTNVPPDLDITVRVFNGEVYPICDWLKPVKPGAETTGRVDIPRRGRYFVQVVDGGGNAASAQPYALGLDFHPADGAEPNNTVGTATPIQASGEYFLSILPLRDYDWFTFAVPQRGAVHVKISEVPADLDVHFRLHNAENYPISEWVNPLRAGAEVEATLDLPAAGNYYLVVADAADNARSPDKLKMALTYQAGDKHEFNDRFGDATPVDPNVRLTANILPKGDVDVYCLRVDAPGAMDVAIGNVAANLELQFRVFNAERYPITDWVNPLRAGAENRETVDLPAAGLYFLIVQEAGADQRNEAPYSLQLAWRPGDASEPDSTMEWARPIQLGQAVQGTILPKRDQDAYVFEVAAEGDYTVAVTNVAAELDIHCRLHNGENYPVSGWLKPLRAGAETIETVKLKPGRYYIYLVDGGHDARATQPYTLTIAPAAAAPAPSP